MAKVDLQHLADCFAEAEIALVQAMAHIGEIPKCVDTAAREANLAGVDVRAFELGTWHYRIAGVLGGVGKAVEDLSLIHQEMYRKAQALDMPVPTPKSGGR